MPDNGTFTIFVDKADDGKRLDIFVASRIADCSRSQAANLITRNQIQIDGRLKKPGYRVKPGEKIQGHIPPAETIVFKPESIALNILYEDEHILVVNKQPGLVVHPAAGHQSGTLVNALLNHCPYLGDVGGEFRSGIVHRLDKDTSGTMVIAKTAEAHKNLTQQFKTRKVQKKYLTLVYGDVQPDTGTIKLPIGRHPMDRKRMSTTSRKSRDAETSWHVREHLRGITLLEMTLKTGRTHQIRVHCAALKHPVIGDPIYRPRKLFLNFDKIYSKIPSQVVDIIKRVPRQMLHAWRLGFTHPDRDDFMKFESPVPADMQGLIEALRGCGRG